MSTANRLTTADVMQAAGAEKAFIVSDLYALYSDCFASGPAMTCACAPRDNLAMHYALMTAPPGSVIVCDAGGRIDGGYFGELAALDARNRGIVGFVIDGSVRDAAELEELGFPVFCVGTAPASCKKETARSVGEPITVRGVGISPGDRVVADRDAVVVVPSPAWPEVQAKAEAVRVSEDEIRCRLRAGQRLSDMLSLPRLT
jgi:4-hydroxy-4-methyl-2-oxoglutarate aldolase